jgi:aldehyde:ferredoxin oxidoreductase
MGGYMDSILEVNLKTGAITRSRLDDETKRSLLGGSAVAAKLFLERSSLNADPLSPANTLFIMTGPLTGTTFPGVSRFAVCAKSPLTGIWGESTCGGYFGAQLKFAGYDGIIFTDAAPKPVYLFIDDGKVELRDASHLWGKGIYAVTDELQKEAGKKFEVLSIGQAGEHLVKYAAISNNGIHFAGRVGMGAVMGFKKLKAIIVRGEAKVELSIPEEAKELRKELNKKTREHMTAQSLKELGTDATMSMGMMTGDIPIKNWEIGEDLEFGEKLGGHTLTDKYLIRSFACYSCPIACKRVVKVSEGPYRTEEEIPGPEYETCAAFGTMLLNKDLAAIIRANYLCNDYGMDTISCGATIAFAMECYEKGLLSPQDTKGLKLNWGNIEAVIELLPKIALREGIGNLLAEGSREAARQIGKGADKLTVEIKGLEVPMHDPRGFHGMGLGYAVSNRGACHLQHMDLYIEQGMTTYAEAGLEDDYSAQTSEGKAKMHYLSENLGVLASAAPICVFALGCITADDFTSMLRVTTGFDYTLNELLECGERIWLLKRKINNLMGVTREDDRLPLKILSPVKEGAAAGSVPDIEKMLSEYYELRGLDDRGIPKRETLEKAGLAYHLGVVSE